MARPSLAAAGLVVLALLLAGCTSSGTLSMGRPFQPVSAPVWKAGYSWTYDVVTSYRSTNLFEPDDRETGGDRSRVTMTVYNTTAQVDGVPAYFVRADRPLDDNPMVQGSEWAYTQDQLRLLAQGHSYGSSKYGARPDIYFEPHYGSGYAPRPEYDPCNGLVPLERVDDGRPPLSTFPLAKGAQNTGHWSLGDEFAFDFDTKVNGMVDVKVPAGTYKAIYIVTDFEADLPPEADEYGVEFKLRVEQWYSPEALQFVKSVTRAEARMEGSRSDSMFGFTMVMELRDISLTPGPESPAAPVIEAQDDYPMLYRSLHVGRTPGEPNIADGPFTATFGLVEGSHSYDANGMVLELEGDEFPAMDWIDPTTHQVRWLVRQINDHAAATPYEEYFGDTIELTFDEGGRWYIEAEIVPLECGRAELGSTGDVFATYYQKQVQVEQEAGLGTTREVATFPVAAGASQITLTWVHQPEVGSGYNPGRPGLLSPSGKASQPLSSTASPHKVYATEEGNWKLRWIQEGVTLGDDAAVTVRIDYGNFH